MPTRKNYQVHQLAAAKRSRRAPQMAETIEVITPDKALWKEALKRAQGDPQRLQTIAHNSVIVWNNELQRARLMRRVRP